MEREKALIIAKLAYKKIIQAMEDFQKEHDIDIGFCWDECIWVDDQFFQYNEMNKE
jgi:hypothetical protein